MQTTDSIKSDAITAFTLDNTQVGNFIRTQLMVFDEGKVPKQVLEYFEKNKPGDDEKLIGEMTKVERIHFAISVKLKERIPSLQKFINKNDDTVPEYKEKLEELLLTQEAAKMLKMYLLSSIRRRLVDAAKARYIKYRPGFQIYI